jgi:hypothetical protein
MTITDVKIETRICSKCARALPIDKFDITGHYKTKIYHRSICYECYYPKIKNTNIEIIIHSKNSVIFSIQIIPGGHFFINIL